VKTYPRFPQGESGGGSSLRVLLQRHDRPGRQHADRGSSAYRCRWRLRRAHGAIKLVIYIGIGGLFGDLIGLLLVTVGLLLWISPVHNTLYAVAGVLLAVFSFSRTGDPAG
jgi:hypothetical protein